MKGEGGSDRLDIMDTARPNPLGLRISSSESIESLEEEKEGVK